MNFATHQPVWRNDFRHKWTELGPTGKLWSFTFQVFPPPPAKDDEPFKPYPMGFIDLDDGLRVLGQGGTAYRMAPTIEKVARRAA
jgi:uncharacterized OB-fold protein